MVEAENTYTNFVCKLKDWHGKEKEKIIPLVDFELTEEDLRVKTAKFKTPAKIDITLTMWIIEVRYYQENKFQVIYGGVIISHEYDETTGIYTYQTQGYQRFLNNKLMYVSQTAQSDTPASIYKAIEYIANMLLSSDNNPINSYYLVSIDSYQSYDTSAIDTTNINNTITNADETETEENSSIANGLEVQEPIYFENKTYSEVFNALIARSNCAIDMYVDENAKLHFDAINLKTWENPENIILTTANLTGYTFKSDATNIITSVKVLNKKWYQNYTVTMTERYSSESLGFLDLSYYFGSLGTYEENIDQETNTTTTTVDEEGNEVVETQITESTVDKTVENEKIARSKYSEGLRDLMSFEIEFNGFIPELHTNMFMWFELPEKHILANYASMVAGIDRTTTRGGSYVLNRYYVEKITTTYNDSGVTTKVTLNPFASSLSSYYEIYESAVDAWQQANCQTDNSNGGSTATGTVSNGEKDMADSAEEAMNRLPPSSAGTITVTGMPSTSGSTGSGSPYSYKKYTKTWRNFCPVCNMANTLKDNPKGVYEGEITCSSSLGGCDADWDAVTGRNKAGSCPNPGCMYKDVFLIDANNKRNSVGNISADVGGNSDNVVNTGGTTAVSGSTGQSCTTNTGSGSYDVPASVSQLANKITSATNHLQIIKDYIINMRYNYITYDGYSNFVNDPEKVCLTKLANCCDGTRLVFNMCAYKGIPANQLIYRHIPGHVYGRYNNQDADWVKTAWGVHWGGGSVLKDSTFPTTPFAADDIEQYSQEYVEDRIMTVYEQSVLYENGYSSFNQRFEEEHEHEIIDVEFEDMEQIIEKYGEYRWR